MMMEEDAVSYPTGVSRYPLRVRCALSLLSLEDNTEARVFLFWEAATSAFFKAKGCEREEGSEEDSLSG